MAKYNGNGYYLSIGGVDVSAYVVDVNLTPSITSVDVTAGTGTAHMQRAEGLYDHTITITIAAVTEAEYADTLLKGTQAVIYGLEGNAAGKPKHSQSFILTPVHSTAVTKDFVTHSLSGEATAAPSDDMFAGGVWA